MCLFGWLFENWNDYSYEIIVGHVLWDLIYYYYDVGDGV